MVDPTVMISWYNKVRILDEVVWSYGPISFSRCKDKIIETGQYIKEMTNSEGYVLYREKLILASDVIPYCERMLP